jgi:hypothetical protein
MLGFGLVHGELGAGEFQQSSGHPHVIGMHVGENNLVDMGPGDATLEEGGVEGFKGGLGVHSAIDQNEARRERDQEDVYGFELEGEWKGERKNAGIDFAKRSHLHRIAGVIGTADKGSGFHVGKAHLIAKPFEFIELSLRNVADDGQVLR